METSFDISKYLSEGEMKDIASKVFTEKCREHFDRIISNRNESGFMGAHNTLDQIMAYATQEYAKKLTSKFEDAFVKLCNEEITKLPSDNDNDHVTNFRSKLVWRLENVALEWIDKNRNKVESSMELTILDSAEKLGPDKFARLITEKIDFNKVFMDIITDIRRLAQ
jgi:hypothetical protein